MNFNSLSSPIKLRIETPLNPSEDPEKVKKAIRNIFGGRELNLVQEGDRISAETEDIKVIHIIYEKIRARNILGVARRILIKNTSGNSTWLQFNKQSAMVKAVNICEDEAESPLGPIKLTMYAKEIQKLINWLAPSFQA